MNALNEPYARIFLLSHMRAFTSLAGHILGSHPQINGYYEMHLSYEYAAALDRQLAAFQQSDVFKPNSRYLFDKLLHNDYCLMPERLDMVECKILLCLAQPEHTIKSIVHLFAQKEVVDIYVSPVKAAQYYIERVKALAEFSSVNKQSYYYFDAALWQQAPERLLPKLTQWLELESPLSERYQTFSYTGKAIKGDSSQRIHSGSIDKAKSDYSHIAIPQDVLRVAQQVYQECRQQIIENAVDSVLG